MSTDQGVQRLGSLLNGLVESLRWAVATLTENLVLSEEHTVDTTHQATTLTVQVGVDLLLEGGLVEVSRANGNTESNGLLLGLAGNILVDGDGGVDTTALTEEGADGTAGALGGDEDDVDVGGNLDLGEVLEDGGETVREVESLISSELLPSREVFEMSYLALELGLDLRPGLRLSGIREQVHDNGGLANGLVNGEQVLSGNPAILESLLP